MHRHNRVGSITASKNKVSMDGALATKMVIQRSGAQQGDNEWQV